MAWREATISEFLIPQEEHFKAQDPTIAELERIEKIDFSGNIVISKKPSKTDMIVIQPGDFVISGINVAKGAMAVYQGSKPVKATIHYSSYTVNHKVINLEYFKRFLKSPIFIKLLTEQIPGGIKTEIKPKHLLPLKIHLPDKEVQNAILNRFLNTEDEYQDLITEIEKQKKLLAKYRQAILQEAIEGKLTADWRDKNPDVEPAAELLKRIAAEKAKLVKQKKIPKQNPLTKIKPEEKPFDVPESWEWCRLGGFGHFCGGGTPSKSEKKYWDEGNIPWVTPKDMKRSRIDSSQIQITQSGVYNSSAKIIPPMSLLFVVRGMILIHTFPIALNTIEVTVNQDMKALMPFAPDMEDFLLMFLNSLSPVMLSMVRKSTHGTRRLETESYVNFPVPLPPLSEQQEIVRRVEARFALCDQLEAQINASSHIAETLSAAILQELFDQNGGKNG